MKNKKEKAPKQAVKEASRKAKRKRLDPEAPGTVDQQEEAAAADAGAVAEAAAPTGAAMEVVSGSKLKVRGVRVRPACGGRLRQRRPGCWRGSPSSRRSGT